MRDKHAGIAEILRVVLECGTIHMFGQQERRQRLKHRHFDMLGHARALTMEQGGHDSIGRSDAAKLVGKDRRGIGRRSFGIAQ